MAGTAELDVDTTAVWIAPDSGCVLYLADANGGGQLDLFSVPVAGGNPVKLNGDNGQLPESNAADLRGTLAISAGELCTSPSGSAARGWLAGQKA